MTIWTLLCKLLIYTYYVVIFFNDKFQLKNWYNDKFGNKQNTPYKNFSSSQKTKEIPPPPPPPNILCFCVGMIETFSDLIQQGIHCKLIKSTHEKNIDI